MDTYSEIINEFNSTFSTNASLCEDLKVGWDLGDCRSFALYQLVEDQRSAPFGTVLYHHIGSYNIGEVYEAEGTSGFRLSSRLVSIEKFFPLSSNEATRRLDIGYRSPWLGGSCAFSSIPFKRWWVDSFKTLCTDVPAQAELVSSFLTREIEVLAEAARNKGHRSGWVYNRFIDKIEYLSMRVNHEFLDLTNYILHPELFFNIVSNNLVSLNEQEKTEMRSEIARAICFDEPFRKRF
ncbi:hypothetical protein KI797_15075 [Aeromonas media]|uniref:hypothetical protein n=1 Tax=Aeromonas media TaxID=651 RepID=UPI001CF1F95C|nr:hypothetical protein [Aeromonas media]UCP13946.1 hypothetical protein KI797_15075 [Aeromonas media]